MKACVIGSGRRAKSTIRIFEALKRWGGFEKVRFVPIESIEIGLRNDEKEVLYKNLDLSMFDCVVPRIGASKSYFGYLIISYLSSKGVYIPLEPKAILISHDKYLTIDILHSHGLPVPEIFLTISPRSARYVVDNIIKPPIVLKLLGGSGGKGVMFAEKRHVATSIIDTLDRLKQPLFIEKYIENPGEDIRLLVVGDKVVASMKRIATFGEKRANLSIGGKAVPYNPNQELETLAVKAAKAIGAEIAGIDIIKGKKSHYIIETNIAPGMKIADVTKIDVPKIIAEYVSERVRDYKEPKGIDKISNFIEKFIKRI